MTKEWMPAGVDASASASARPPWVSARSSRQPPAFSHQRAAATQPAPEGRRRSINASTPAATAAAAQSSFARNGKVNHQQPKEQKLGKALAARSGGALPYSLSPSATTLQGRLSQFSSPSGFRGSRPPPDSPVAGARGSLAIAGEPPGSLVVSPIGRIGSSPASPVPHGHIPGRGQQNQLQEASPAPDASSTAARRELAVAAAAAFIDETRSVAGSNDGGDTGVGRRRELPRDVRALTQMWADMTTDAEEALRVRRAAHAKVEELVCARRDRARAMCAMYHTELEHYRRDADVAEKTTRELEAERHTFARRCSELELQAWGGGHYRASERGAPQSETRGVAMPLSSAAAQGASDRAAAARSLVTELETQITENAASLQRHREQQAVLQAAVNANSQEVARLRRSAVEVERALRESTEAMQESASCRELIPKLQRDLQEVREAKKAICVSQERSTAWFMEQIRLDDELIRALKLMDFGDRGIMTLTPSFVREVQLETTRFHKKLHDVVLEANTQRTSLESSIKALSEQLMHLERQAAEDS